jgi:hypothetical protein
MAYAAYLYFFSFLNLELKLILKIAANTYPPDGTFFSATVSLTLCPEPADLGDSHIWTLICKVDGGILEGIQ